MASRKETFPLYSLGSRTAHLDRLRREAFDVIVIGGGITGAGVAWDAATRGLRVALVEQGDFAGGTSSRSTKLLHGGLRYLQQADIGLVREALQERGVMQRLAPHLVELYPFLFPIYGGLAERAKLAAGLTLYDALALGSGAPRHSWLGADATRRLAPGLTMNGLDGAFVYRDAQTDDARMVVEVLRGAVAHGAVVVNRVAMREVTRHHGTVTGAMVEDTVTGETTSVDAPVVVAATGVWLERLVRPRTGQPRVRPAKGVHLFVPLDGFPADAAVYASTTRDRRLFFIVPWLGVAMLGTTDTPYDGDLASPETQASEVEYLLEATSRAFPSVALKSSDILSTQAGLRPLVSTETGDDRATRTLSREDRVWEAEPGVVRRSGTWPNVLSTWWPRVWWGRRRRVRR
ncbi:MAG: glycerol-3-phosphate dehydrogenase/oxidase [Proteobacteria bacterium]|nr:glycerol-3-phosphate dehydrogenase/oxidase [Pseudomonadota bacterium]